ncbi:hypothetical protein SDC9_108908 [bioreactor metagenome]|uniref:HTH cro/C1-type domain-containing protein n=1 Tax=bioreactor metagenome TaxID=1076179 RepID=A0A645B9D9_9ZZZZ
MNKTEKLKNIILNRYGSIREFSKIVEIPSTTLTSALDKGIGGMAVDRVIKICEILDINIKTFEPLKPTNKNLAKNEERLLSNFKKLNDLGKNEAIKRVEELTEINKYIDEEKEYLKPLAAHDKKGDFSKEDKEYDLNLMKDDELWK